LGIKPDKAASITYWTLDSKNPRVLNPPFPSFPPLLVRRDREILKPEKN